MIILSAEKISKGYPDKPLLEDVSLTLQDADKVGVIGVNGTGKTTLLDLLAGRISPDRGTISRASGARIAYLAQNPAFDGALSLLEIVLAQVDPSLREEAAHEAKSILTRLGFFDFDRTTAGMSEGEKKRVAIAQALMSPCELLLLDEPTNHLDSHMVQWLEAALKRYRGAIVMVTHDRYFLQRVTDRIIEIDRGALYSYAGNYAQYLLQKAQREEMAAATQRKDLSLYRRELAWMQRGARARGTKSKARIQRFEALGDAAAAPQPLVMETASARLGRKTIEIDAIRKAYGERCLVDGFSYVLPRDARVGIVGRNGCGKSTLLQMIAGQLPPDAGSVTHGETVRIGYLSQRWDPPPDDMRVIDYIQEEAGSIATGEGTVSAAKMLERFLFPASVQWTPAGRLSGGEKRRLFLLRVLMRAPNILLLDEPTNDLDTETLTVLEAYLEGFAGAVVAVSHDRYFLDKVADTILAFEADGAIRQYAGGYSDYLEKRPPDAGDGFAAPRRDRANADAPPAPRPPERPAKARFSFSEQREYGAIDADIAALEDQLQRATAATQQHASDYEKLLPCLAEKERLEAALAEKMDRWVYLNELAERIRAERPGALPPE